MISCCWCDHKIRVAYYLKVNGLSLAVFCSEICGRYYLRNSSVKGEIVKDAG